jgi:hypothetical protein
MQQKWRHLMLTIAVDGKYSPRFWKGVKKLDDLKMERLQEE